MHRAARIQSKERVQWTFHEYWNLINGFSMGGAKSRNCILKVHAFMQLSLPAFNGLKSPTVQCIVI